MSKQENDNVTYRGGIYSLTDLAYYMDEESREALHFDPFTTGDRPAQEWWDEYVRRYPADADHAANCAPLSKIRKQETVRANQYSVRLLSQDGSVAQAAGEWADDITEARELAACMGHAGIWAPGTRAGDGTEPVEIIGD